MTPAATFFLALVPILMTYFAREYQVEDEQKFKKEVAGCEETETFDFIIVGGGTTGCVVARRLADAQFKVLILESGGTPPPITKVPVAPGLFIGTFNTDTTYLYNSFNQKYVEQQLNGTAFVPAGKMLGGGSNHNVMIYQRGSPYTYDSWANTSGDDSWRYENVLQYFRKFENYRGNYSHVHNGQHGYGGPITISSPYFPAGDVWLDAGKELGFEIRDSMGPQEVGFSPYSSFTKDGFRVNSYGAYIKPIEKSQVEYLTIRRYSPVNKVLFKGKRAIGVEYERHGVKMTAKASKEVILSAGTYMSPVILIKSGIGPKAELKAAKVKTVQELPYVGKNLHDHVHVMIGPYQIPDKKQYWSLMGMSENTLDDILYRGHSYIGFPSSPVAHIESDRAKAETNVYPDLQLYYQYQTLEENQNFCWVGLYRPRSRGVLTVNNSATSMTSDDLPIINFRYLSDRSDEDVMLDGINFCLKVMENTTAYQTIGATYAGAPPPACANLEYRSEEYWRCFIRQTAFPGFHSVGTCKMGKKGDLKGSVVDSKLRVQGVTHLRVIDNSIIPTIPCGNTAGPAYMIGEKAAAEMLCQYRGGGYC